MPDPTSDAPADADAPANAETVSHGPPRDAPARRIARAGGLLLVAAFALGLLVFVGTSLARGVQAGALLADSETIDAEVTVAGVRLHRDGEPSHYVFEVDGQTYRGRGTADQFLGQMVAVRYDPTDPSVNALEETLRFRLLFGLGTAALLVGFVAWLYWPTAKRGPTADA